MAAKSRVVAQTRAQREQAAQAAAQEAERVRQAEEMERARQARIAAQQVGGAPAIEGAPLEDAYPRPPAVQFTHPETGGPVIVDPTAVTHVQPGKGSVPHHDAKKMAAGEMEIGPVTEIGTIGGLVLKVLEDVETVAGLLGL